VRATPGASVWQRGYPDHAARDSEDIRHIARYIAANPLRAKLVDDIMDHPYWDAIWLGEMVSTVRVWRRSGFSREGATPVPDIRRCADGGSSVLGRRNSNVAFWGLAN
jgi:hypothetical protein